MKKTYFLLLTLCMGLMLVFTSCEKEEADDSATDCCAEESATCCAADNGDTARMAMQEEGYTELEVNPIEKVECYFEQWDKTIMTPVSGLFEYYDQNDTWVASIDFGDGTCDEWVTKTWDINIFPDHPEGSEDFSVFKY